MAKVVRLRAKTDKKSIKSSENPYIMLNRIMQTDENLQKCWSILENIQPGKVMELLQIPEDCREVFISCTKQYIDCFNNVEFNADFSKLRKYENSNSL